MACGREASEPRARRRLILRRPGSIWDWICLPTGKPERLLLGHRFGAAVNRAIGASLDFRLLNVCAKVQISHRTASSYNCSLQNKSQNCPKELNIRFMSERPMY